MQLSVENTHLKSKLEFLLADNNQTLPTVSLSPIAGASPEPTIGSTLLELEYENFYPSNGSTLLKLEYEKFYPSNLRSPLILETRIRINKLDAEHAIGAKPGHGGRSGGPDPRSDVLVERLDECVAHHLEPAAQIIPDRDAEVVAGLGEAQESITAVAADIAARPGTDLTAG